MRLSLTRWPDEAPERPTLRGSTPFAAVALLGVIGALLPPYSSDGAEVWWGLLAVGATFALALAAVRRDRRTWLDPTGPWVFYLAIALLRDTSGGAHSGLAPLVALPILWFVMFGTRLDLLVSAGLTVATFVGPMLTVGPPRYPLDDWRRAMLWCALSLLVAPVVQATAHSLVVKTRREQELSAQLRGIMQGATLTSIISTDVYGRITSFSAGAESLLGYEADEIVGHHDAGFFHDPAELEAVATELGVEPGLMVLAALAHDNQPSRIWTYLHKDGRRLEVRLVVTPLWGDTGLLVGYLGVAIEVTEAMAAERALREAEARWRVVMDHLPDTTILVLEDSMRVSLATGAGAMRTLLGDVVGRELREVSGHADVLEDLVQGALAGHEGRIELTATRSGAEHDVYVAPLPAQPGAAPHAMIMSRDVSEQRARERELIESRTRAQRIFTDAPHGIAILDRDATVVAANPALVSMFRLAEQQMVGRRWMSWEKAQAFDVDAHLRQLADSPAGRTQVEATILGDTGQPVVVMVSSVVLAGATSDDDQILMNVQDISERRRYEENLAHLADHDPLTGLANRRRFSSDLARHLDHCRRYGVKGALLLLDLDHFKEVNDTLGHSAGDELIIAVGELLRRAVRGTDLVARLGGDEFAILLVEADRAGAELVAENVVTSIREHVRSLDGSRRRVTTSLGVVMVDERNLVPADLLAAADLTMYDAKEAGRDRWALLDYETHDGPRIGARMAWNTRISNAVDNGDFVLHLQPIWDIKQGRVTGAEALLRLADGPNLVYPNHFLYVAEMSGLIKKVDAWVLSEAVGILGQLQQLQPDFRLEVNVSGRSIDDQALEETLHSSFATHGVDPTGLVLEITETAAVADVASARAFAERVMGLGCRFALDDFGAGFGSFYYLKHLLFDYVKIDGEFVAYCHVSPTDRAIVNSIVGIAHGLGKRTIAEFVSDAAILEAVTAEGADFAQGYFIGEPVPFEEFRNRFLLPVG